MKKIYSQEEMEQILKQNIDIPDIVERRIRETYEKLDLPSGSVNTGSHRKTRKPWKVIAAAAALIAALGATAFAATRFFSAYLTENGEDLSYSINIDPAQKDAHEIHVTPAYVPDGYSCEGTDGFLYWYNEAAGGFLSVIPYNAADLYKMSRTMDEALPSFSRDTYIETVTIRASSVISGNTIRRTGDVMTVNDDGYEGIEYQTLDIKVTDTLPLADYPKEKYLEDYDSTLASYLNEDGTLKPHKRFISEDSRETEDAEASFVIVTTRLSNTGNETKDVYLSPFLRYLDANGDGSYTLSRKKTWPAEENWAALTTDGFPFWQSAPNNGETCEFFTTLDPGETVRCTSVYVVDNDVLATAYMQYFNVGAALPGTPELYVKVTE